MRFQRLQTDAELKAYADRFAEMNRASLGESMASRVAIEHLKRYRARGLCGNRDTLHAGDWASSTQPPPLLECVPEDSLSRVPSSNGATLDDGCEVARMWRPKWLLSANVMIVWHRAVVDSVAAGKRVVLRQNDNPSPDSVYDRGCFTTRAEQNPSTRDSPQRGTHRERPHNAVANCSLDSCAFSPSQHPCERFLSDDPRRESNAKSYD